MENDIVLGQNNENTKKMYMLAFSGWDMHECKEMLNKFIERNIITYWRTDIYNTFFIVSDIPVKKINEYIHDHIDGLRFLLVEMTNVSGWIPADGWKAINKYVKKNNTAHIDNSEETDANGEAAVIEI